MRIVFKILVVEDDTNTLKLMCAVLKQQGFIPLQADDGYKALEILDNEHVDLVIVDMMLPGMSGLELTVKIREAWTQLPLLMVTAKHEMRDKHEGFLAGIDDYMVKPADEQEMVLRIRALLRRSQIAAEQKIVIGSVTLNYNSYSVLGHGQTILLPQKEFQLLFKLMSYPDTIFTRIQLLDEIWGMDADASDHTLNVHISRLRDKFYNWEEFEIVTIRGLGYKGIKKV